MTETAQNTTRLLSAAATTNATTISTIPCTLYGISGFNAGTVSYLKIYDVFTSTPAETDTPRRTEYLAANTMFRIEFANGLNCRQLGYRLVTAGADNSTAAVAAGAVLAMNIDWS